MNPHAPALDAATPAPEDSTAREHVALVAVQLELSMRDFASEASYRRAIERAAEHALERVRALAGDAQHRLLVFPEDVGHFVPLVYAPRLAHAQPTLTRAMAVLAARHPLRLARAMWSAGTLDPERGLMLATMPRAEALVESVFSGLARRHRAYVVAGSHLSASGGLVSNTSHTFDPTGRLVATTHKVNLVVGLEDDSPGGVNLARGHAHGLPIVHTPFGALATLICYDGFHVPHTHNEPDFAFMGERAAARGARIIANPAANPWPWNERWVHAPPGDRTLRREQWRREGLFGSLAALGPGVRYGVTAHLCARIMDFHFHGRSEILERTDAMDASVRVLASADSDERGEVVVARVPAPAVYVRAPFC